MIVSGGNSYCLECMYTSTPALTHEESKERERQALEGLSELFGT